MGFDINNRNTNARNFGLGSRDMSRALSNAYRTLGNSYASNKAAISAFNAFCSNLKEMGVKDLKNVSTSHIERFKDTLEKNNKSSSTIQNYISFVNQAMTVARLDDNLHVNAVKELGVEARSGIAKEDKSTSHKQHEQNKASVDPRLAAQMSLQRELGLRFKESCLINSRAALKEAKATNQVTISRGTKGGRERVVPITNERQTEALDKAAKIQGNHHSMIPADKDLKTYKSDCYKHEINFHGERHNYANDRYEQLAGCKSPVRAGIDHSQRFQYISSQLNVSYQQAKQIDLIARSQLAQELGHNRVSITNAYIG